MKVKKFDVLTVPLEVEYISLSAWLIFGLLARLMLVRVAKFNLTVDGKTVCSFYRLIIPRFLKGGVSGEEQ